MLSLKPLDSKEGQKALSHAAPGQFVNIHVPQSHPTFLRRPISICEVQVEEPQLTLFIKDAGSATHSLCNAHLNDIFNILLPLGRGFDLDDAGDSPLLIAGGIGIAPMLFLARKLKERNISPTILLGAITAKRLILEDELEKYGSVYITTDDGTLGHKGLITSHPILEVEPSKIYCCGPLPMMKAVAKWATNRSIECEVSLENMMACGLGACLCCVENTEDGHICVCKDGPVINIKKLKW